MKRGDLNRTLLLNEIPIWRTPYAIQSLRREEDTDWNEFLKVFVEDIAFGASPEKWIERLIREGNIGLAAEIDAVQKWKEYDKRINHEEDFWKEMFATAKSEADDYLESNRDELSERDVNEYEDSVELAGVFLSERAYGDAVAVLEQLRKALEGSVARRRARIKAAFDTAEEQISYARKTFAELVGVPSSKFPGGESLRQRAKALLVKSQELMLERQYPLAKQMADWVVSICLGKEVPVDEIDNLIKVSPVEPPSDESQSNDVEDIAAIGINGHEFDFEYEWTAEDDEFLVENYDVMSNSQLILRFYTSEQEIEQRIRYHGLVHEREGKHKKTRFRNPYVAGKPLRTDAVFVGRDDVFQFIASGLELPEDEEGLTDRNLIALLGHRRTGKTSLLLQLKRNMRSILEPRIPIFIDLESMLPFPGGLKNFFYKLAYRIQQELSDEGVILPEPRESDFADPSWQFQRFLHEAESAAERGLVLMMDEFQAIEPRSAALDRDVYKMLRSVIQHDPKVDFIISGTMQMERIIREYEAAMFGSALIKRIDFLDEQDARKLINAPVSSRITYSKEAVDLIVEMTACHPYFVQLVCWTLTRYLIERGKTRVYGQDVERILPQVIDKGVHFDEIWATDTDDLEQYIMAILGELVRAGSTNCTLDAIESRLRSEGHILKNPDDLPEAMQNLINRRILCDAGDGRTFRFQVRIFGQWVNTNKPIAVVKRDIQTEAVRRQRRIDRQPLSH